MWGVLLLPPKQLQKGGILLYVGMPAEEGILEGAAWEASIWRDTGRITAVL